MTRRPENIVDGVQPLARADAGFALLFVDTICPLKGLAHLVGALALAAYGEILRLGAGGRG